MRKGNISLWKQQRQQQQQHTNLTILQTNRKIMKNIDRFQAHKIYLGMVYLWTLCLDQLQVRDHAIYL